jgi:rhodanese-related sulfurtransferase
VRIGPATCFDPFCSSFPALPERENYATFLSLIKFKVEKIEEYEVTVTFLQNNIALIAAALMSGGMLLWPLLFRRSGAEVDTLVAVQLINYKDALVLDVREGSEYSSGHVPNSKHIPADKLEERLHELEKFKSKPIILIHRSGVNASGKAGPLLRSHGFEHVHDLEGGFDAWQKANLPIVKK